MSIAIRESVAEAPVKRGNRWRVIVARPGVGSSGTYSEEVFRRDAHKIIAPGGQAFINHDDSRNPKDMIGVYPEGSFWSEEDKAVVSELDVFSHWRAFVEEVGPHCGISLYAMGSADEDGNVTEFIEDRLNGADLVARPGLVGSGLAEKLYESATAQATKEPGVTSAQDERKLEMDQELKDALKGISDVLASLVAEKHTKAEEAAQVEANDEAVSQKVESITAGLDAIEAARAELFPSQIKTLRAEAKEGTDVAPLIEAAKKVRTEAEEALRLDESAGRDFGGDKVTRFGAWS
jgi:hypothetical protein